MAAMRFLALPLLLAALAPVQATEVVRLPDATRDALLAAAANGPEKEPVYTPEQAARSSLLSRSLYPEFYAPSGSAPVRDGKVHGEMTMFAGSGGTVGFAGTAIMPLGQNSTAAISVMQGSGRGGRSVSGFGFGFSTGNPVVGVAGGVGPWNNVYGYGPGWPYSSFGIGVGGYGLMGGGLMGGRGRFGHHPPMGWAY